ncbi:MAG: MBL fold metallo-hydrolase [Candidatus Pacebacteria bacterium]|jgi:competence protein ComEC|nr:MBL fold metallo-hydrolase [Candidatus Paceibacterota bacterium]
MTDKTVLIRLATLVTLFGSAVLVWWSGEVATPSPYLTVTFLDVGQGDAILIETPDGVQALIDGGRDGAILRELARELLWGDRTLDLVIGTHPDQDHIGGLVDVLARYDVSQLLTTENRGETMTASSYQDALLREGGPIIYARAGQVYTLGASTTLTVLSPTRNPSMLESNTSSIVVRLSYGDVDFMLTGDAPMSIEDYLVVAYGEVIQSEVLKLGHHGSKTSTSELFLKTVAPTHAVVSAGKDNSYGHPHEEVVERVRAYGAVVANTATDGPVTFVTDGIKLWLQ